eukprot:139812-Rhodomonas_salina.1
MQDIALKSGATAQHTWVDEMLGALIFADNGSGFGRNNLGLLLSPEQDQGVSAFARAYRTFGREALLLSKTIECDCEDESSRLSCKCDPKSRRSVRTVESFPAPTPTPAPAPPARTQHFMASSPTVSRLSMLLRLLQIHCHEPCKQCSSSGEMHVSVIFWGSDGQAITAENVASPRSCDARALPRSRLTETLPLPTGIRRYFQRGGPRPQT